MIRFLIALIFPLMVFCKGSSPELNCQDYLRAIYTHKTEARYIDQDLKDILVNNQFRINRSLFFYFSGFGTKFLKWINKLTHHDHWIDSGAGLANALKDYIGINKINFFTGKIYADEGYDISKKTKAKVSAISYRRPPQTRSTDNRWKEIYGEYGQQNYRYLEGRALELIDNSEIGEAKIITDLYGPFTYSKQPDVVLQKYLDLLEKKGAIFLGFSDETHIDSMSLVEWIERIDGISVIRLNEDAVMITKLKFGAIKVPNLIIEYFEPQGVPPMRRYSQQ